MRKRLIEWEGRRYYAVVQFDGRVVDLQTTSEGGGYFTALPISPKDYRANHPTSAGARYRRYGGKHIFTITDDHGKEYELAFPAKMSDLKNSILAALKGQGLIVTSTPTNATSQKLEGGRSERNNVAPRSRYHRHLRTAGVLL